MTDEKEEPINISVNCSSCGTQWMTSPGQRFRCLKCDEEICVPPEELYKIGYRLLEARLARAEELLMVASWELKTQIGFLENLGKVRGMHDGASALMSSPLRVWLQHYEQFLKEKDEPQARQK